MIRRSLATAVATALAGLAAGTAPAAGFVAESAYVHDANSATAAASPAGRQRAVRRRAMRRRKAAGRCAARRGHTRAPKRATRCRRPAARPVGGDPAGTPPPAAEAPVQLSPQTPFDPLAVPSLPVPTAPGPGGYVSIRAHEFAYSLSRPVVAGGPVTFELRNGGEDPHDLVVSPEGSREELTSFGELGPGLVGTRRVDLGPGRYYLWCSLDGHEAVGMKATLRVE